MKEHSEDFKNKIVELGRQIDSKLIYGNTELVEELYSVTPHFKGNMLKSTMKQLDVETTEDIPIGTEVNYQLGLLVDDEYEWLDYGNYIVYSSEKQEDKGTYKLVCYDKLLNSMKEYEGIEGTFPMTLREYLNTVCTKIGIEFGSNEDNFANYDRIIPSDRYLGVADYTYRDVLDEIAQATGSMICLDEDDKLIVKYINEGIDNYNTVEGTSFELDDASGGLGSSITKLEGNTSQSSTPTPSSPVEVKTVSGDSKVLIRGKNLAYVKEGSYSYSNYSSWNVEDGKVFTTINDINYQGGALDITNGTTGRWAGFNAKDNKITNNGGSYTLSIIRNGDITYNNNGFVTLYYYIYKSDGTSTAYNLQVHKVNTTNSVVVNLGTNEHIGYLALYSQYAQCENVELKIQLEHGNQATQFEPCISNSYTVDFGGKNKLPNNQTSQTINGVTFTVNSDKSIKIQGIATAQFDFYFVGNNNQYVNLGLESGTYNLSGCSGGSGTTYMLYLVLNRNGTLYYYQNFDESGRNVIVEKGDTFRIFIRIMNGTNINTTMYPMLEEGNVKTQYSPYVENPIELCKIGTYQDKIDKTIGKNIFRYSNTFNSGSSSGVTVRKQSGGTYTMDGTSTNSAVNVWFNGSYTAFTNKDITNPIALIKRGTAYTIKDCAVFMVSADGLSQYSYGPDVGTTQTFTLLKDAYIVALRAARVVNNTTYANRMCYPQIEENSTSTEYEPCIGKNKWYIKKQNRHLSLPIKDMNNMDAYPGWKDTPYIRSDLGVGKNTNFFTGGIKYFSNFRKQTTSSPDYVNLNTNSTNATLFLNKSMNDNLTQTEWKEQYPNLVVELYYTIINGPIYEEITNETLISQLNAIENMTLIEGKCYVDFISNEKPTMTLRYYQGRTLEEINEEYLKDVNVDFGEKYGPVNSIVLSRSGESDNVYIQDEDSIEENGLHELKIVDNQLMNFNDRSDYLPSIFEKLDGLEYYINDFTSTGICYLELGDRYYVNIGNETYSCIMFNDEIDVTLGIQELVHTDMPKETKTDYAKADKTDRKINQTYLIVDKQNQQIQTVVNEIGDRSEKQTTITQDIDGINSEVSNLIDITIDGETSDNHLVMDNISLCQPVELKVRPIVNSIEYIYPKSNRYPSGSLYSPTRYVTFRRTYIDSEDGYQEKTEDINYELPCDLLYLDSTHYDELQLDYNTKTCKVIKRVEYNSSGNLVAKQVIETLNFEYPYVEIRSGDYEIFIPGYTYAYIYVKLIKKNEYTTQFTTQVEVETQVKQTENEVMISVNQKVDEENFTRAEIVARINNDETSEAAIKADAISLEGYTTINGGFSVDTEGNASIANGSVKINEGGIQLANGRSIVGGNGMLTQFQYNGNGLVGHMQGANTVNQRVALYIPVYIPHNFIITEAKLFLTHTYAYVYEYTQSGYQQYNCYARNVKLYHGNMRGIPQLSGGFVDSIAPTVAGTVVSDFGSSSGKTFPSSSSEDVVVDGISEYLREGMQYLYLADYVNNPSDWVTASRMSGNIDATLYVTGYLQNNIE